jgi:hypothetical protein
VLIYKTYEDARTYQVYNEANTQFGIQPGDISWVRSLSGYRLGVILPKGYTFLSLNTAAQMSVTDDGRVKVHFANPSGQSNPFTLHARRTTAAYTPAPFADVFFDDIKTLYDLGASVAARRCRSTCSSTPRSSPCQSRILIPQSLSS